MNNVGAMKEVQNKCYRNSKEVDIKSSCWNPERRRWLLDGIGRMARNWKKMRREEETNQRGQQEPSQGGQKAQQSLREGPVCREFGL